MQRRELLVLLSGAAAGWPSLAQSQASGPRPLIVWFASGPRLSPNKFINALLDGLREQGDIEGQNFEMVYRTADNQIERMPALAAETLNLKPAIIVAGAVDSAMEARKLTSTIPI